MIRYQEYGGEGGSNGYIQCFFYMNLVLEKSQRLLISLFSHKKNPPWVVCTNIMSL